MSNASSNNPKKIFGNRKNSNNDSGFFGHPALVIVTALAIFFVSQVVAFLFVGIIDSLLHPGAKPEDLVDSSAPAQFFYILLAEGLAVLLVYLVLKWRGQNMAKIGLGRRPVAVDILKGLLGFAAFFAILIVVNAFLSHWFPDLNKEQQDVGFNTLNTSVDKLFALMALVILPPIGEETLVRGYLYSGLRAKWRFMPAMIVTSLMFGLAHLQTGSGASVLWAAGIDTFVLSLVLVYLREKTGALYAGMLVHALNNLIAFGVHFH
jgi:membrane protease YdiL (CAAX protease family)